MPLKKRGSSERGEKFYSWTAEMTFLLESRAASSRIFVFYFGELLYVLPLVDIVLRSKCFLHGKTPHDI